MNYAIHRIDWRTRFDAITNITARHRLHIYHRGMPLDGE